MPKNPKSKSRLFVSLNERAKELKCLFEIETLLSGADKKPAQALQEVVDRIGSGWQYADICQAEIEYAGMLFKSSEHELTEWYLEQDMTANESFFGKLRVFYTEERPFEDEGPFLTEEVRLIQSLADRLGTFLLFKHLEEFEKSWQPADGARPASSNHEWRMAVKMILGTDQMLYLRVARKMLNHLCAVGIQEAQVMLKAVDQQPENEDLMGEVNIPGQRRDQDLGILLSLAPFELADKHLGDEEIVSRVQQWIQDDRASFLIKVLGDRRASLSEIAEAVNRSHHSLSDGADISAPTMRSINLHLCEHLLTDQLNFNKVAKDYAGLESFYELLDHVIIPPNSHGKLGGKGAGLLLAKWILDRGDEEPDDIIDFKIPRTWYLASDGILKFVAHNDLEDVYMQKFREIDDIRRGYPNIIQLFKNSVFPPEIIHGLSSALDDLGDIPLIVRSSSLLEDRLGTAFSGKYKSLFLANQGTKQQRLSELLNAIAEVYASVFGPDPIEYRRERELLEFNEEMGILIQEVVGRKVGRYFFPAFAGVIFSRNEFRWSPRIKREDGLVRMVPGLGTRAVDRVGDDYPVLAVPGKPGLRVNVAIEEVTRYAPKYVDLINLDTCTFETLEIRQLMREIGGRYPGLDQVFSVHQQGMLKKPVKLLLDPETDEMVATFDGLLGSSNFVDEIAHMLKVLEQKMGTPVDVEFAHDGEDFYLLQCRPQSHTPDVMPSPIPKEIPPEDCIFTANRYVSNGYLPEISHLVYVDPEQYGLLESREKLLAVGRAVGALNKILPKRKFVLIGPGRWGSRGDLKLGVSVTYADINNTSMLIEVARQSGSYVPDLSFGTHFFQDLVESHIRYLPLYPDEEDVIFNERFLNRAENLLGVLTPEFADLSHVVKVIDVPAVSDGRILRILMNADLDEAVCLLDEPGGAERPTEGERKQPHPEPRQFWQWRQQMAEMIALKADCEKFGVKAMYLIGSVKNATCGPASDIDLMVHCHDDKVKQAALMDWLDGWGLCLSEVNYLRTGYRTDNLLDVHIITDKDIENKSSYAVKIGAVTDAARVLKLCEE